MHAVSVPLPGGRVPELSALGVAAGGGAALPRVRAATRTCRLQSAAAATQSAGLYCTLTSYTYYTTLGHIF